MLSRASEKQQEDALKSLTLVAANYALGHRGTGQVSCQDPKM